jgi:hypothetical protein
MWWDGDKKSSRPAVYCPPVTRGLDAKFKRADDLRSLYQVCIWLISKCRQRRQCQKQAMRVPFAQLIGESKFASAQKTEAGIVEAAESAVSGECIQYEWYSYAPRL